MITIGESVSRVRGILKGSNEDSFLTDRFVYSIISKYAKALIKREQRQHKIMRNDDLFEMLPYVELTEVNKIEADCAPIKGNCTILRTLYKLPQMFNGSEGPLIRKVYSIDGSHEFEKTTPANYISINRSTNFKYNKSKYYWFKNGYLYFPNVETEGVMVEAIWEEDLSGFCLNEEEQDCRPMQDKKFPLPEHLFAEVEQMAEQEFGLTHQIPETGQDNSQAPLRQ